jgi:FkbM family methyltransferase
MSTLIEACVAGDYTLLFDVGANYGEFVASAIGSVPSVVAVEANPIVARCLKQSFEGEEGVSILAHAVSDQEATLTMRINPQYSGGNRLVTGESAPTPYFLEGCVFALDVPCRRLSDVMREERGEHKRVAMKMDVEGHEPVLLAELLAWLEEQQAGSAPLEALLVMFEFNSNSYEERQKLTSLLKRFTALGAQLSHLAERKQESAGRVLIEAQVEEQALERPGEIFIELRPSSDA